MAGDVKLKLGLDTTEMERAFGALIKKMQGESDKLKLTPSASKAAPGGRLPGPEGVFRDALLASQRARNEQQALEATNRLLDQKRRKLDEAIRSENISASQKILQEKEINRLLEARERIAKRAGNAPNDLGLGRNGITDIRGLAAFLKVPVGLMGAVGTGIAAGTAMEGIRAYIAQAVNRARVTESSAFQMQGQGGQRLNSFLNGGASEELMFNSQRKQAASIAEKQMEGNLSSPLRLFNRPLETIFGRFQNQLLGDKSNQLGLGTEGMKKDIEANQFRERAVIQEAQFQALKSGPQGALRTAIGNKYLRDFQRNLDFQRQTGLSDTDFRTNYLGGIHGAGFSDEQGMGMSSAIQGAGGSTRAATGNAGFALQMQRAFDLTNAGKAIGSISGQLGSTEMSKEALIKIQAEGTRIGLNQSDFREENRKFVEMAANVINQSNATSGAGVEQLVGTLGRFMGDRTMTGMEAGKNAYEAYQRQSNIQSGPSAAMRAAGMMRSPILSKLNGEDQAALFTMNQADVNPDDLGIQALAKKTGRTPQELVNAYHEVQNSSLFQRNSSDLAISNLSSQYKNQTGPVSSGDTYGAGLQGTQNAEGEALNRMRIEEAAKGLDTKSMRALARARASGDNEEVSRLLEQGVRGAAESGQTGRVGDEQERVQSQAARMANELFNQIKDSIVPAANAAKDFAKDINELTMALSKGTSAQKLKALEVFTSSYPGMMPSNPPSAGPPANGAGQ